MILTGIIFITLGILIKYGKMYNLIAGYNTRPAKEKAKIDIKGIATVFRNAMFGMALIIFIGVGVAKWLNNPNVEFLFLGLAIFIGLPYLLITANSSRYKNQD